MRRLGSLFLGLGLSLALAAPARAQQAVSEEKPIFLVTDVVVGEGVAIEKDAARLALATRFGRLKQKLEVRSLADAKATIDAAALAQLAGATSDAELAQVEKYLQVDRLVLGRITDVGGVVDITVKVFNVKEGITEVQFARRLGASAPRSMVLTLLDTLADNLLAWTLDNYTDGEMSAEASKFASMKAAPKKKAEPPSTSSADNWSGLGVAGGVGAGVGAGVATGGLVAALTTSGEAGGFSTQNLVLIGVGAGVAVAGGALVVVDALTE